MVMVKVMWGEKNIFLMSGGKKYIGNLEDHNKEHLHAQLPWHTRVTLSFSLLPHGLNKSLLGCLKSFQPHILHMSKETKKE